MTADISPEERLLDVIQKEKNSTLPGRQKITLNPQGLKRLFLGLISKRKTLPQGGDKEAQPRAFLSTRLERADLKLVNKTLGIVLSVIIAALIFSALNKKAVPLKLSSAVSGTSFQPVKPKPLEDYLPLKSYIDEVKKRDVFHPYSGGAAGIAGSNLAVKDLGLAGTYQGQDQRLEAMIEDKSAKKTYFLKEGDEIKGFKVKSILKDRVILQYGDQEIEIM